MEVKVRVNQTSDLLVDLSVSIGSASSDVDAGSGQALLRIADKRMFAEKSESPDSRK